MVNDLDEHDLENLHEKQVGKSTLMKSALTHCQQDIVLKKEPRSFQLSGTMVNDIEHQQQNMSISQKERSRDRAAAGYPLFGSRRERSILSLLDVKRLVLERRKCSCEHDPGKKKGRAKELDQEAPF